MTTRPCSSTTRVRFPPAGLSQSSDVMNHVISSSMFATSSSRASSSRNTRRGCPFGFSISPEMRGGSGFGGSGGGQGSPRRSARCFARHMPSRVSASTPATSSMRRCTSARRSSRAVSASMSSGWRAWSMRTTQARFAATVQREPGRLAFAQLVPRALDPEAADSRWDSAKQRICPSALGASFRSRSSSACVGQCESMNLSQLGLPRAFAGYAAHGEVSLSSPTSGEDR